MIKAFLFLSYASLPCCLYSAKMSNLIKLSTEENLFPILIMEGAQRTLQLEKVKKSNVSPPPGAALGQQKVDRKNSAKPLDHHH